MLTFQVCTDVPAQTEELAGEGTSRQRVTHVNLNLFSVGIFYRGIVAFYPHVLHELSRQTALPHSTCSKISAVFSTHCSAAASEAQTSAKNHDVIFPPAMN